MTSATTSSDQAALQPGQAFGMPKYSTQRRMVVDNQNQNLSAVPLGGSQINVQTSKLDQLDIVQGEKLYVQQSGTWTAGAGKTIHNSPFGVAATINQLQFKLQAAYNTINLTGPLAALIQGFRPQWGSRNPNVNLAAIDPFAGMVAPTSGQQQTYHVDCPFGIKFDEYFELSVTGDPVSKQMDAIVSPTYMAAQARVVTPTIVVSPQMPAGNALLGPKTVATDDATSAYTGGSFSAQLYRDAYWNANNPAANPPQHPWLYTRDYFTQGTGGQPSVGVLIQNTGVSVGQVLSLFGFVWDPAANSGFGAIVPFSDIQSFELITGGSLQNLALSPQALTDRMFSQHSQLEGVGAWADGAFVIDLAQSLDGAWLTNANAINTYLVNGVQLNVNFIPGSQPSSTATVYLGVEALKVSTS